MFHHKSKSCAKAVAGLMGLLFSGVVYAIDYTYDELHRLIQAAYDNGQVIQYTYDAAGNLLSATDISAGTNTPPDAGAVSLSGTFTVGATLSGVYTYHDADGDSENGSSFRWQTADDNAGSSNVADISGATTQHYILATADGGKFVRFCVTPADGTDSGTEVCSAWNGPVTATPEMLAPVNNSTLAGNTATFTWQGAGIQQWWLSAGSATGRNDYFDSGSLAGTASVQVTGLPVDGSTVYVRLWYHNGQNWQYLDYTYTAYASTVTPAMVTPVNGAVLSGSDMTFTWEGTAVWWLYIGTSAGSNNLFDSGNLGSATSVQATGLPVDGNTVYARLWYDEGQGWQFLDYSYTAYSQPGMVTPVTGSVLSGSDVLFTWQGSALQQSWLYLGSSLGASNLFSSGNLGTATSVQVTGLPVDGNTIYARLWYDEGSGWQFLDYSYTAYSPAGSVEMVIPTADSILSDANVTFTWQGTGVQQWWLYIGTTLGTKNLYDSGSLTGATTSANVTGLPQNGSTVYARLWYNDGSGMWKKVDYTYTAAGGV